MIWIVLFILAYFIIGGFFAFCDLEIGDVVLWPIVIYVGAKERWAELKRDLERYK